MLKQLFIIFQKIAPQQFISKMAGKLANCEAHWLKNSFIRLFMRAYSINLSEAIIKNIEDFPSFNAFFTRKYDMSLRPLSQDNKILTSPADGQIAQFGHIEHNRMLQAKGHYFELEHLLANENTPSFINGEFFTVYLAPNNYHRVHMPIDGRLKKTIFVPGKLYSVNQTTAEYIPELYSQNERLICLFDTAIGEVAVILVGAMIVGSIQLSWMDQPIKHTNIHIDEDPQDICLRKGEELGLFKLGSTVVCLFPPNTIQWASNIAEGTSCYVNQDIAKLES